MVSVHSRAFSARKYHDLTRSTAYRAPGKVAPSSITMHCMRVIASVLFILLMLSTAASAADPRVWIMGVWPNRLRLFDEASDEFVDDFTLRHGAVTNYGSIPHTPDYTRLYFVTDRMETVEVFDPVAGVTVDEVKLSTPERRVRITSVVPFPDRKRLYLRAGAVALGTDRYEREELDLLLYDLDADTLLADVQLPKEVEIGFFDTVHVAPDGESMYVIGETIWQISTSTHEVLDRIEWSRSSSGGYGGIRAMGFLESSPSIFHGPYQTTDPVANKSLWGIFRLDLNTKSYESFELGPALDVGYLGLSPDGKFAYVGLHDFAVVDLEKRRIVERVEEFERGRTNMILIVSADGSKLYVTGVGNSIEVYDAKTLEKTQSIFVGADITSPALAMPRDLFPGR